MLAEYEMRNAKEHIAQQRMDAAASSCECRAMSDSLVQELNSTSYSTLLTQESILND